MGGSQLVTPQNFDVVVVGGGPAGLAAALWLGRYRRSVCVLDSGEPRNQPTWAVHGFPGLPEIPPLTLQRRLAEQAEAAGARLRPLAAVAIRGIKNEFELATTDGGTVRARRVLLAFGRRDRLPELDGLPEAYGTSVFHCPDCDGPTVLGKSIAVLGSDRDAAALALYLTPWADAVVLLPGADALDAELATRLARAAVAVIPGTVVRLESEDGMLRSVHFEGGRQLEADALFFHLGTYSPCDLHAHLGCRTDAGGHIEVDRAQETSVPGVYAAGDITGHPYLAIVAAAAGVRAALAMHRSLLPAALEL
ncbi:MAG: NAD(P)/FAD-dependent oxidoreductase [Longimicrobiales bacterium]